MGICCVDNQKNIVVNVSNSSTVHHEGVVHAFSRRRSKRIDKGGVSTKRSSVFAYNNENINDVYVFQNTLGSGYFGTVKLAHLSDEPGKEYAVKSIDKTRLSPTQIECLSREIDILSTVDHPNIIRYYETYTDSRYFHIVTEYLSGGDLLTGMARKKRYCEKDISSIINKLLSAISHIHSLGIVHRDLKPDNILFESENPESDIKIIDFGVSRQIFKANDDLNSIVGTPYYVAPEVLSGKYDKKVDIWSIGIIMYVLMTGKPPFNAKSKSELFNKIQTKELPYPLKSDGASYSPASVNFLMLITKKDPAQRPGATDALNDKWFDILKNDLNVINIPLDILENMKSFMLPNLFQRTLLKLIVKELKTTQIQRLKEAFIMLDKDNTGYLDPEKLEMAYRSSQIAGSQADVQKIMLNCNLNYGNSERVNYTSFIAAALDKKELFKSEILKETFKHLDTNDTGFLTIDGILKAFERTGKKKSEDTIIRMFSEIGLVSESKVNFDQFKAILTKDFNL